ncbi:MAG: helix-turn-helix transcriptional regulator [Clostridia bacterium]|nr:helix-turn-helix transcriptional regulator [Clostridia bacterium]
MAFSDVLRNLRRKNDMTQEELAEALDMSPQAVSRWETGTAFPDSTVIRKLAYLFDVTTDYLLEVDPERVKRDVGNLILKTDEMNPQEAAQMLRDALKEYPRNKELIYALSRLLYYRIYSNNPDSEGAKDALWEARTLVEWLYEHTGSTGDLETLLRIYRDLGIPERGEELLKTLRNYNIQELRIELATGEDRIRRIQDYAYTLLTRLNWQVYTLSCEESLPAEQRISMLRQMFEASQTLMPDDPLSSRTWQATHIPFQLAQLYAVSGDREQAIHWLGVMYEASKNEAGVLNSPTFRGLPRKRNGRWHEDWMLKVLNTNRCFDDIRDDPRLISMREELEATLLEYGYPLP